MLRFFQQRQITAPVHLNFRRLGIGQQLGCTLQLPFQLVRVLIDPILRGLCWQVSC